MLRSTLLAVVACASAAMAKLEPDGINCDGSSNTQFFNVKIDKKFGQSPNNQVPALASIIGGIDDNRLYKNGEHIACLKGTIFFVPGSICAFLQSTSGGMLGRDIKTIASELGKECGACGSIATGFFGGDKDVNHGMLTMNFVSGGKCSGVC
ncbi:hypothetical protein NQ176_g852 [Zarea fungicola]|uniref:Uncharacterized protein n=1 Tax=Zarea fungicola TaxID=93591 RepID=A0ACC1NV74_9HYPO|nr:hypothetical protein NQ176_g852 [Lecanicillium fungicola]